MIRLVTMPVLMLGKIARGINRRRIYQELLRYTGIDKKLSISKISKRLGKLEADVTATVNDKDYRIKLTPSTTRKRQYLLGGGANAGCLTTLYDVVGIHEK